MTEETLSSASITPAPDVSAKRHAAPLSPRRLARSLLVVVIGFAATKLISLVQVFIIADEFGVGSDYDTFAIANSVPTQLIRLLGAGAIAFAFIPVFSSLLNRDDSGGAWRLASQVLNTLALVTIGFSLIVAFIAVPLVDHLLAPGFDSGEVSQTAEIIRILLLTVVIFSLSSLLGGILNAHNHFLMPVLAPIFYDIGLLFGIIFFVPPLGVYGLAWGTVLGAVMHLLIQTPGLVMFKFRWSFSLGWNNPELRAVIRLMIPRILASGVFAVNVFAFGSVASQIGEGAPSAMDWGIRIMDIPEALIGTALGLVIFPTLSALNELGKTEQRRQIFSEAIRFILVMTIPAAALMITLGKPAVSILFTDPNEAAQVYAVVQILALAMIFQATNEIVARAFYAQKDTVVPLIASVMAMVANLVVLGIGLAIFNTVEGIPTNGPLGVGIPAIGYTVAFLTEQIVLTLILRRRWGNIDEARIWQTTRRTFAATVVMVVPVILIDYALAQSLFADGGRIAGIIRAGMGGIIGIGVFFIAAYLINLHEVKQLPSLLRHARRDRTALSSA